MVQNVVQKRAALWYEPLWVLGAAFSVFGAWLADRMYEAEEPA